MAFGGSFKEDHPYATGLLIVVVAAFGIAGSVTGQLAAMLAALWVPDALIVNTSYGGGAGGAGASAGPGNLQPGRGLDPTNPNAKQTGFVPPLSQAQGGPPDNQASIGSPGNFTGSTASV